MRIFTAHSKDDLTGHKLRSAAHYGNASCISKHITADTLNSRDTKGNTALIKAAELGNNEAIAALCSSGAEIDLRNNNGNSALLQACRYGHSDCVETLLKYGAAPNLCNTDSDTIYHETIRNGKLTLITHMTALVTSTKSPSVSPLNLAAALGHDKIVALLLANSATKVNQRDSYGYSAAMYAALFNQEKCLTQLINLGANLSLTSNSGESVISLASNELKTSLQAAFASNEDEEAKPSPK